MVVKQSMVRDMMKGDPAKLGVQAWGLDEPGIFTGAPAASRFYGSR
jgi:hypothetical protein